MEIRDSGSRGRSPASARNSKSGLNSETMKPRNSDQDRRPTSASQASEFQSFSSSASPPLCALWFKLTSLRFLTSWPPAKTIPVSALSSRLFALSFIHHTAPPSLTSDRKPRAGQHCPPAWILGFLASELIFFSPPSTGHPAIGRRPKDLLTLIQN